MPQARVMAGKKILAPIFRQTIVAGGSERINETKKTSAMVDYSPIVVSLIASKLHHPFPHMSAYISVPFIQTKIDAHTGNVGGANVCAVDQADAVHEARGEDEAPVDAMEELAVRGRGLGVVQLAFLEAAGGGGILLLERGVVGRLW